jgi:arsenical pump membrane protein
VEAKAGQSEFATPGVAPTVSPPTVSPPTGSPPALPRPAVPRFLRQLGVLDWIAIVFALLGLLAVATGVVPIPTATGTVKRLLPLLIFLGSVIVLAELTAAAEVFDVIAARLARIARGNYFALFLMCVAFASITTATLNLDTTAVLLTPVMLATAIRIGIPTMPLAMTTVWLANTASLLLPVSNLTNLLAMNRIQLSSSQFAARLWLVELASVGATTACLWLFYWRRGVRHEDRYTPPDPYQPRDRSLFIVAAASCVIFVVGLLVGVPIQVISPACMGIVLLLFLIRRRSDLTWRMIPWPLLAFVTGLFLTVDAITAHGFDGLLRSLLGSDTGPWGVLRAAGIGAGLSNTINNLPAYVAIEAVIPASPATHNQLLGLLIGTNVGPIITPWASLATLIWYARCRSYGLDISWPRFLLTGTVTALVTLSTATGVLILIR